MGLQGSPSLSHLQLQILTHLLEIQEIHDCEVIPWPSD